MAMTPLKERVQNVFPWGGLSKWNEAASDDWGGQIRWLFKTASSVVSTIHLSPNFALWFQELECCCVVMGHAHPPHSVAWFTIGVNPSKVIWNVLWRTQSTLGSWCPFMSVPEWCCCICSYARLCLIVADLLDLLACVHHSTSWVYERTSLRCWKSPEKLLICRTLCWMEPKGMILESLLNVNPKNITSPSCSAQICRIH